MFRKFSNRFADRKSSMAQLRVERCVGLIRSLLEWALKQANNIISSFFVYLFIRNEFYENARIIVSNTPKLLSLDGLSSLLEYFFITIYFDTSIRRISSTQDTEERMKTKKRSKHKSTKCFSFSFGRQSTSSFTWCLVCHDRETGISSFPVWIYGRVASKYILVLALTTTTRRRRMKKKTEWKKRKAEKYSSQM